MVPPPHSPDTTRPSRCPCSACQGNATAPHWPPPGVPTQAPEQGVHDQGDREQQAHPVRPTQAPEQRAPATTPRAIHISRQQPHGTAKQRQLSNSERHDEATTPSNMAATPAAQPGGSCQPEPGSQPQPSNHKTRGQTLTTRRPRQRHSHRLKQSSRSTSDDEPPWATPTPATAPHQEGGYHHYAWTGGGGEAGGQRKHEGGGGQKIQSLSKRSSTA